MYSAAAGPFVPKIDGPRLCGWRLVSAYLPASQPRLELALLQQTSRPSLAMRVAGVSARAHSQPTQVYIQVGALHVASPVQSRCSTPCDRRSMSVSPSSVPVRRRTLARRRRAACVARARRRVVASSRARSLRSLTLDRHATRSPSEPESAESRLWSLQSRPGQTAHCSVRRV